jgi:hypothetical protein
MADPIAAAIGPINVAQKTSAGAAVQNQQSPERSFESVLKQVKGEQVKGQPTSPKIATVDPPPPSGNRIEQLRLDLMERTKHLAKDRKTLDAMVPELTRPGSRHTLMQEAMSGISSPVLAGNDFKSILGSIENRWLNVERIMTSNQELSTGELLGLQARLYQVAQHVEVVSKVIDQVTGGVKTILNTNI